MRRLPAALLTAALGAALAPAAAAAPHVPPGFGISVYASGVPAPTALAFGPRGALFAASDGGAVYRIARRHGRPQRFLGGLQPSVLGLAWIGRLLYVSDLGRILRVADANADGRPDSPPVTIVSGLPHGRHQNDGVVVGPDRRLYLGIGSTCDACSEDDPRSATVVSLRPDGFDLRVVARGLRNPFGLAFDVHGRLWATDNGRDEPAGVPDELNRIRPGGRYGWPDCWGRGHGSRCAGTLPPAAVLEPHASADGLAFAPRRFSAGAAGDAFVALWGTYVGNVHGRYVARVRIGHGPPRVSRFATGFEHPLAIVFAADGAMLVADYGTETIWRIAARPVARASGGCRDPRSRRRTATCRRG